MSCKSNRSTCLCIISFLVVDELLKLLEWRDLLLHLLLSLRRLELGDLLVQLAHGLKASISKLAMDVRAAGEHLQLVAKEQIVILSSSNLQEIASLDRLRDLHGIDRREDL